jgi:CubicO group peptidase (beta-lactamase class C family)
MPSASPSLDPRRLDRAFEVVARQTSSARASYAALAVARSDGLVRSEAWLRGERLDAPCRTSIASITKPITATAVLQLVEEGRLVLSEPIATYLPDIHPAPPPGVSSPTEPITAWHVLTHTSGLSDSPEAMLTSAPPSAGSILARLSREPLRFAPGSAFAYTSDSFYLLAALIERVSGLGYPEFLAERVLRPLGMVATTFDPRQPGPRPLPLEGTIAGHGVPGMQRLHAFVELAMPGGGLWSVPDDIASFGRTMLLGGTLDGIRILGRPFVELMVRDHTADVREVGTGRRANYGLGWGRPGLGGDLPVSSSTFAHNGASGSTLLVDPENDVVVVYLRNEWGASMTATLEAVQSVYGAFDG